MKKKRPTCWIMKTLCGGEYTLHETKPSWIKPRIYPRMAWLSPPGSVCYEISGQTISALLGDEWELPKAGELLEVVDGVPKRVYTG